MGARRAQLGYTTRVRTSARNALVLGASLLVLGGGLGWLARSRDASAPLPPLVAAQPLPVPQGALLVARVDLRALRGSPLGEALSGKKGVASDVQRLCGFDPLDALDELVLSIPMAGTEGDFGVAARGGRIDAEELTRCAAKIVAERGGRPKVAPLGSFALVRDEAKGPGAGELAVRNGGPVLLGSGAYLRAMMAVADGSAPSGAAEHAELEKLIEQKAMRVTFVITDAQRAKLSEEADSSRDAPMFLAMRGGGVGLDVGPFVTAHATFACDGEPGAARIAKALRGARDKRADSLAMRLAGLAPLLRKLDVEAQGKNVHAHVSLPSSEVARLLARLTGATDEDGPTDAEGAPPVPPELTSAAPAPSALAPPPGAPSASARAAKGGAGPGASTREKPKKP